MNQKKRSFYDTNIIRKEITVKSIVLVTICMIIANIIWAIAISHDWKAAVERSFFQMALGAVIIINAYS